MGVFMSTDCSFGHHISVISKKCSSIAGWILQTITNRDRTPMLTLFKSIVSSRLDFGCQLWSPHQAKHINSIEKVQRSFTKHISGVYSLSYSERLSSLNLYSVQRRRDRYITGLGSSTVDQVLKYTKYPKYIPSTSTGQVLSF